jgi:hypothetical protein
LTGAGGCAAASGVRLRACGLASDGGDKPAGPYGTDLGDYPLWCPGCATSPETFEPLVFLERLAALVPPPRSHLVLCHGVLSSHASWRAEVLPRFEAARLARCDASLAGSLTPRGDDAQHRNQAAPSQRQSGERPTADVEPTSEGDDAPELRARRLRWAQLLQRVFGLRRKTPGKALLIKLRKNERSTLKGILKSRTTPAVEATRARIVLLSAEGLEAVERSLCALAVQRPPTLVPGIGSCQNEWKAWRIVRRRAARTTRCPRRRRSVS